VKRRLTETAYLRAALDSAISSKGSAELAVLHLFKAYDIDLDELHGLLQGLFFWWLLQRIVIFAIHSEKALNVSFSKVKYRDIAPLVGLDPYGAGGDMTTFNLYRARMPTSLFKKIIQNLETQLKEYGEPNDHENEEARSRYLAPVSAQRQPPVLSLTLH
jgi:hypothetical protein